MPNIDWIIYENNYFSVCKFLFCIHSKCNLYSVLNAVFKFIVKCD